MAIEYFCCFHSYRTKLSELSDEQIGRVFKAAMLYSETGETSILSPIESLAFSFIRYDIDQSHAEYEQKCEKNRANASGRIRSLPNVCDGYQTKTKTKSKTKTKTIGESNSENAPSPPPDEQLSDKKTDAKKHKYGEYGNVLLSDEDMEKLKAEFPSDYSERIERLSAYMAQTGKTYKNHLATIRNWAKSDASQLSGIKSSEPVQYSTDDFLSSVKEYEKNMEV